MLKVFKIRIFRVEGHISFAACHTAPVSLSNWGFCVERKTGEPEETLGARQEPTTKRRISHCRSRSRKYAELSHLTLLLCRERHRNVQWVKTHLHRHCPAHSWNLCLLAFSLLFAIVVCYISSLLIIFRFILTNKWYKAVIHSFSYLNKRPVIIERHVI